MAALHPSNLTGRAVARDPEQEHRASTTLELFFDLIFVVAVGRVASSLDHELLEGHVTEGVVGFLLMFFGLVWAWMQFTWFASGHDSDDVPYRLLVFVQITGALVFATGVSRAMIERDFTICVFGYTIMRLGLVGCWLRVARDVPEARPRALRYALWLTVMQSLWWVLLAMPDDLQVPLFVVLGVTEMVIVYLVDRGRTVFHSEHIEERYGLFTIILLGESIVSAAAGFQAAFDEGGLTAELLTVGLSALVGCFAAWWLYFDHPGHLTPTTATAFRWGYGHVVVFAALAGVGAGTHVAAEVAAGHGPERTAALAVAIPSAAFLGGLALLMVLNETRPTSIHVWPKLLGAVVVLLGGIVLPYAVAVAWSAAVLALLALWMVLEAEHTPSAGVT